MSLIGWSRKFEEYQSITDIPARVRKVETWYWCGLAVGVVLVAAGLGMMSQVSWPELGMFLALCGVIDIALIKLWAHIRLATYQIILELQLRDRK